MFLLRKGIDAISKPVALNTPSTSALFLMIWMVTTTLPVQAESQSGYQIALENSLWGPQKILVSDKGIKLIFLKHSFSGLLHAPDWKVILYSDRQKKYYEPDSRSRFGGRLPDATRFPASPSVLRGLPVTTYKMPDKRPYEGSIYDNYMPQLSDSQRGSKQYQSTLSVVQDEISCLPEKQLPRQARTALRNWYGIAGLPLQYQIKLSDGQKITKIKFTGWKKVDLPPSTFADPTGYQRVASMDAIISSGISSKVEEFSREWGGAPEDLGGR